MKIKITSWIISLMIAYLLVMIISCRKDDGPGLPETGSLTDAQGNVYKTVRIGDQWWMAENLRTSVYRNGDSVTFLSESLPDSLWSKQTSGACCLIDSSFGLLYNFNVILDPRGIAPQGWHIPTDEEWKQLEKVIGLNATDADLENWRGTNEGNKMKIDGGSTSYWMKSSDLYTIYGNNSSGFSAIGGACRVFNGSWGELTHNAFWWTSSTHSNDAWYRGLDYNKPNVFRYFGSKNYGFSIRCVKD